MENVTEKCTKLSLYFLLAAAFLAMTGTDLPLHGKLRPFHLGIVFGLTGIGLSFRELRWRDFKEIATVICLSVLQFFLGRQPRALFQICNLHRNWFGLFLGRQKPCETFKAPQSLHFLLASDLLDPGLRIQVGDSL
jgi:hypothetical protein